LEGGRLADADLRARIAEHKMFDRAFGLTVRRAEQMAKAGQGVGHMASMFKVAAATLNQEKSELMVEALGTRALGWGDGFAPEDLKITRDWLRSKGNSIEGGTTEVNLNVVAKRVLGLRDHQ
jgi:alkylation response protein AidB-like acyl-CoA dehydrogenase